MTEIEILATGPEFVQKGIRGIEPVIEEILIDALEEIQITAYAFTPRALHILDLIQAAAERGVKVMMVVNNFDQQVLKVKLRMKELSKKFNHVKIRDFKRSKKVQLHAKVIVVDRKTAVVGSANFSWSGMYGNYEVGLLIRGEHAWKLGKVIDVLACTQ